MSVFVLDPTLLAEEIHDHYADMKDEMVSMTGVPELEVTSIYAAILESLDNDEFKYGHMATPNMAYMSSEHVDIYIEELIVCLVERTGIDSIDEPLSPIEEMHENELDKEYAELMGAIGSVSLYNDPEVEALEHEGKDMTQSIEITIEDILGEYLTECLKRSIIVLTGYQVDVKTNNMDL